MDALYAVASQYLSLWKGVWDGRTWSASARFCFLGISPAGAHCSPGAPPLCVVTGQDPEYTLVAGGDPPSPGQRAQAM